jgi:hypothetical protein
VPNFKSKDILGVFGCFLIIGGIKMTNKTIQMNLTEEQFNLIWGVLNEYELEEELDIQVCNQTLNEMEDIMEQLGLEKFGDPEEV